MKKGRQDRIAETLTHILHYEDCKASFGTSIITRKPLLCQRISEAN